jgi:hypothetical protein
VRVVVFRLMLTRAVDVFDGVNQVALRNHGVVRGLFKFARTVKFGGGTLVLGSMLQKFGGFQMMIHTFLRHAFRVTSESVVARRWDRVLQALNSPGEEIDCATNDRHTEDGSSQAIGKRGGDEQDSRN